MNNVQIIQSVTIHYDLITMAYISVIQRTVQLVRIISFGILNRLRLIIVQIHGSKTSGIALGFYRNSFLGELELVIFRYPGSISTGILHSDPMTFHKKVE